MKTKPCPQCHKRKELSRFSKDKLRKDGHRVWCKKCQKEYYLRNLKKITIQHKKYNQEHKAEISQYQTIYQIKNKKKLREYRKKWQEKNKPKIKKYLQTHKKEKNKYMKEKRKNDINFKLACYLRTRIGEILRGKIKANPTIKLLGCSMEYLKQHLENQFKYGMNWDNWGRGWHGKGKQEWHVDHIKPIVSFNLNKPKEQKKCFHYINLRPLWAKDNWERTKMRRKNV